MAIYAEHELAFDLATVHDGGVDGNSLANAELIVRAVNSIDELIAAAEELAMEVDTKGLLSLARLRDAIQRAKKG